MHVFICALFGAGFPYKWNYCEEVSEGGHRDA